MRALVLIAGLAGCWTGSTAPRDTPPTTVAVTPRPLRFRVVLERSACLGNCPVYRVTIHGDGRVEWDGIENVAAIGRLDGRRQVSRPELDHLARMIDDAKFFDRNEYGELETQPVCTTVAGTTTCSYSAHFCSDTTHAKISVSRGARTHMIDNDHCDDKPGIDEIEAEIDHLAGTAELIGR
jgi:hypothetical protein